MAKKRDFPWKSINIHPQHQLLQLQHQKEQFLLSSGLHQNVKGHWNRDIWGWDSFNFVAKPIHWAPDNHLMETAESGQKRTEAATKPPVSTKTSEIFEDGENLTLKLWGGSNVPVPEEPVLRQNKRIRSGSPGRGGNYPMCQVDDCGGDLSNAKDYHRRHKVCELHSKMTEAPVGQQMQRFCQQCSRFHPLSEFDEGKRSCRRRLAGHNRRRRKNQLEDASSRLLMPANTENNGGNQDIISLLTILAHMQGKCADKMPNDLSIHNKDRLNEIRSKINTLPSPENSSGRLPMTGGLDLNVSQAPKDFSEHSSIVNGTSYAPLIMNDLAGAESSSDPLAILSQVSGDGNGADSVKVTCLEQEAGFHARSKQISLFQSAASENSNGFHSAIDVTDCSSQDSRQGFPLQLFNSSTDDNSLRLGSTRKYLSSDSSNQMDERSPSSSPLVEQNLFPLHSSTHVKKCVGMSICRENDVPTETRKNYGKSLGFELFRESNRMDDGGAISNLPYFSGDSSCNSEHSPDDSSSGSQERTGQIIFKLFDKDPSDFPGSLRNEIFNWLSHSPSEMESYIRPGCVVLSIYASMPSVAWTELQENLFQHVDSLIQNSDSDFWRSGSFLVHTDRKVASHKDGKIRLLKSYRAWNAPELISVSPVAVVPGKETPLTLRGRNLSFPGTKIHYTYMGGYFSEDASGTLPTGTIYDCLTMANFNFRGGAANQFGRCFIEVENDFKGNSFPLIIADATVCQELRLLESEFEKDAGPLNNVLDDQVMSFGSSRRVKNIHFLNELGWLFQGMGTSCNLASPRFSFCRIKFLITFSVDRDWPALVKILMDYVFEVEPGKDGPSKKVLEFFEEMQILVRAVKRKCKNTVNLLLHYTLSSIHENTKKYLFLPNQAGPGGLTPLHLAACTQASDDIVDELTNDPQDIGLKSWSSLLDSNGLSPQAYASMRSHHSYNQMVTRKIIERRNHQVSLTVRCPEISSERSLMSSEKPEKAALESCAQCAAFASRRVKVVRGAQGLLNLPYIHPMLAIAAVCVCVCVFFRMVRSGFRPVDRVVSWEAMSFGPV